MSWSRRTSLGSAAAGRHVVPPKGLCRRWPRRTAKAFRATRRPCIQRKSLLLLLADLAAARRTQGKVSAASCPSVSPACVSTRTSTAGPYRMRPIRPGCKPAEKLPSLPCWCELLRHLLSLRGNRQGRQGRQAGRQAVTAGQSARSPLLPLSPPAPSSLSLSFRTPRQDRTLTLPRPFLPASDNAVRAAERCGAAKSFLGSPWGVDSRRGCPRGTVCRMEREGQARLGADVGDPAGGGR